jgi:hypothetical protein
VGEGHLIAVTGGDSSFGKCPGHGSTQITKMGAVDEDMVGVFQDLTAKTTPGLDQALDSCVYVSRSVKLVTPGINLYDRGASRLCARVVILGGGC